VVKLLGVLLAVAALAAAGAAAWYVEPWSESGEDELDLAGLEQALTGSSCRRLAGISARLAEREREPSAFLRALGLQAAGIRPPPRALADLARGGSNRIPGRGFLARFDDGSAGQARHFAGIAVATTYFGSSGATRWISENLRRDPPGSADGLLTEEGILFATEVLSGELALEQTPQWLLDHLCRRN
jgi:hypothetical protein